MSSLSECIKMPYPGMPFNPELQNLANGMANGDYSGMPGWPSYPGLPTPGMVSFFQFEWQN